MEDVIYRVRLTGVVRIYDSAPGFALPVFAEVGTGTSPLSQDVSKKGLIRAFVPIDIEQETVYLTDREIERRVGDRPLLAFEGEEGYFEVGERVQIIPGIEAFLKKDQGLSDRPFLRAVLAEFCGDVAGARLANVDAINRLRNTAKTQAYFRINVLIRDLIKEALSQLGEVDFPIFRLNNIGSKLDIKFPPDISQVQLSVVEKALRLCENDLARIIGADKVIWDCSVARKQYLPGAVGEAEETAAKGGDRLNELPQLWPEGLLPKSPGGFPIKNFKSLRYPLWTQNKARLIQAYLQLFEYITHHGTYIDGFAAPQEFEHPEMWAAKLVLEMEPKWFRDFWLCDLDPAGVEALKLLQSEHASARRRVNVVEGDFNEKVYDILNSGQITERTATFALLDQRTFECEWDTVKALSRHKSTGNKIELFYFFATGWVDRSLAAVSRAETKRKIDRWWGCADWHKLLGMEGNARAKLVAQRFEQELGYSKAVVYPIHSQRRGGRVMYHMIHATDHPEAFPLMVRAYRKISGRPDLETTEQQLDFDQLLQEIQKDNGA